MNSDLFINIYKDCFNLIIGMLDISLKSSILIVGAIVISFFRKRIPSQMRCLILFISIFSLMLIPVYMNFFSGIQTKMTNTVSSSKTTVVKQKSVSKSELQNPITYKQLKLQSANYDSKNNINVQLIISLIWFIGVIVNLLRILVGTVASKQFLKDSKEMILNKNLIDRIKEGLGLKSNVTIFMTNREYVMAPITVGFFNSVILMPSDSEKWEEDCLKAVLAHELSHVKRKDNFIQVLTQLICSFYWFNPLVWIASKRLRFEREIACDDNVLSLGIKPHVYAQYMLDLVKNYYQKKGALNLVSPLGNKSNTEERITNILDKTNKRNKINFKNLIGYIVIIAFILIPFSMLNIVTANDIYSEGSDVNISVSNNNISIEGGTPSISLKNVASKYIPTLWPILNGAGKIESLTGKVLSMKFKTGEAKKVVASADGVIEKIGTNSDGEMYVVIRHKNNFKTVYENVTYLMFSEGETVEKGYFIGEHKADGTKKFKFKILYKDKVINPIPFLKVGAVKFPNNPFSKLYQSIESDY